MLESLSVKGLRPATLLKRDRCFPIKFVEFVRTSFSQNTSDGCFCFQVTIDAEGSIVIPPGLFNEDRSFILTDILFCDNNENKSKDSIAKFQYSANGNCKSREVISIKTQEHLSKH